MNASETYACWTTCSVTTPWLSLTCLALLFAAEKGFLSTTLLCTREVAFMDSFCCMQQGRSYQLQYQWLPFAIAGILPLGIQLFELFCHLPPDARNLKSQGRTGVKTIVSTVFNRRPFVLQLKVGRPSCYLWQSRLANYDF